MKNLTVISKSETFEDIVFEDRNKSYGAYELNKKNMKYLVIAFLISLFGVSTAVAIPFLNSFKTNIPRIKLGVDVIANITDIKRNEVEPPTPPPSLLLNDMEKKMAYIIPVIVDKPVEDLLFASIEEIKDSKVNIPSELPIEPVKVEPIGIDEPAEEIYNFVEENASFMGGGIEDFHTWVLNNITYPKFAIDNGVFGKQFVEFCVNSKGQVVDVKFIRNIDPSVDNETLRVLLSSPLWTPAKQGGRPVKQRFTISIIFQMN
jgi:protein TonB